MRNTCQVLIKHACQQQLREDGRSPMFNARPTQRSWTARWLQLDLCAVPYCPYRTENLGPNLTTSDATKSAPTSVCCLGCVATWFQGQPPCSLLLIQALASSASPTACAVLSVMRQQCTVACCVKADPSSPSLPSLLPVAKALAFGACTNGLRGLLPMGPGLGLERRDDAQQRPPGAAAWSPLFEEADRARSLLLPAFPQWSRPQP